jgi:ribosomal protein RSM22 (predicted rRNA methylase)
MRNFSPRLYRAAASPFFSASAFRRAPRSTLAPGGEDVPGLPAGFVAFEDLDDDAAGPPPPGPLDHLFAETQVGWRAGSNVPDRLIRGVRQLLRRHNVKHINDDFDALEHQRLKFSLQELNTSAWFRKGVGHGDNEEEEDEEEEEKEDDNNNNNNNHGGSITPLVYGPKESLAYTARRVVPAYSALARVFTEVKRRRPNFNPKSLLDFGSGPAPSVWSSDNVWPGSLGFSNGAFSLIEPSRSMSELGRDLLNTKRKKKDNDVSVSESGNDSNNDTGGQNFDGRYGGATNTQIRRWSTLREFVAHSPSSTEMDDEENVSTSLQGHHLHDIVLASNVISELGTDHSRDAALEILWHLTAPGGMLILLERGNQWGSNVVNRGRELVLAQDASAAVVAPCTHRESCPLLKAVYPDGDEAEIFDAEGKRKTPTGRYSTTWCHFGHRSGDETIRRLVGNRSSQHKPSYDKFSYMVLEKRVDSGEGEGTGSLINCIKEESQWGRIVRPPLRRGKHVVMDLCASSGAMERRTFGKKKHKKDGVYRAARKAEYGALWPEVVD